MIVSPVEQFRQWYAAAQDSSPLKHKDAVCVSTVDRHGVPEGRFVDLKEVSEDGFIFCTHLDSDKGLALAENPNVALTFWWDHIERQVRVVGTAERISDDKADTFFQKRSREAQLTSWVSQQSSPLEDRGSLEERIHAMQEQFDGIPIPRPGGWGGYCVVPTRIEFLTFKKNRMHERLLFFRDGRAWHRQRLQP